MTSPAWPDLLLVNLRYGRDRARTLGELAEAMGAPRRALEQAVEQLRRAGSPICTGPDGVWLGQTEAEIRACAERLNSRVRQQYATVRAMRRTAARYERAQQMEMFG